MRAEIPDLGEVSPYTRFSYLQEQLRPRGTAGYMSATGKIYLNPLALKDMDVQEIGDIIAHEQEHVRQRKERGGSTVKEFLRLITGAGADDEPYFRRLDEMGAFKAERDRQSRMGRPLGPFPSFETGRPYYPRDVELPPQK